MRLLVDDEPFDVRLRHAARATSGCSTCATASCGATVEWTSPAGQAVRVRSTRLVSFVQRAVAAICYEVEAVGAAGPDRRAVDARRQRAGARAPRRPPRRGRAARAARRRVPRPPRPRGRRSATAPASAGCGWRPRSTTSSTDPTGTVTAAESEPTWRGSPSAPSSRPAQTLRVVKLLAYGWSSGRSMPALRDQVDAALAAAHAHRLGRARRRRSARYLDDVWDRADVEIDGDAAAAAGGAVRALPGGAGRRAGRAAGDPGQGADRPRLRRAHVLGHGDVHAAGADLHRCRTRRATRCCWRHSTLAARASAAPASCGLAGAAFPWRTIRGEECSGYWPAGTAGVPHQRRHRRRGAPLRRARPATTSSSAEPGSSCSSRRRACGRRSATTTPRAASASTA